MRQSQITFLTKRTDFDICTNMTPTIVSVTDFRDNLAEYLNAVRFEKQRIVVKKNRSIMAELVPPVSAKDKTKKRKKRKILPEAFGMWRNRWPKTMSSVDIVNKWREEAWRGNYGD